MVYISEHSIYDSLSSVKSPICSFDAKSGVLCAKCEAKVGSGEISQEDVIASIKLSRLAERNADINRFNLVHAVDVGDELVLVLKAADVSIARGSESILQKIEAEFNRKVWFVESESSDRSFIETLFYPTKVLSANLFWLPDGSKVTRVMVAGSVDRTRVKPEKIRKIAKAVRNIELLIEFER
jgi:transcription antitermination factor NusA-like protein